MSNMWFKQRKKTNLLKQIMGAIREDKLPEAEKIIQEEYSKLFPDSPTPFVSLADSYFKKNDYAKALKYYQHAEEIISEDIYHKNQEKFIAQQAVLHHIRENILKMQQDIETRVIDGIDALKKEETIDSYFSLGKELEEPHN